MSRQLLISNVLHQKLNSGIKKLPEPASKIVDPGMAKYYYRNIGYSIGFIIFTIAFIILRLVSGETTALGWTVLFIDSLFIELALADYLNFHGVSNVIHVFWMLINIIDMKFRDILGLDGDGFREHFMAESVVRFYRRAPLSKPSGSIYVTRANETKLETLDMSDPKNQERLDKLKVAINILAQKAVSLNEPVFAERAIRLRTKTTIIALTNMRTSLLFSNPDKGLYEAIHPGRRRNAIYMPIKLLDNFDINKEEDMEDIAMLLNGGQRFLDAYNDLSMQDATPQEMHIRLEQERAIVVTPKEEAIGSLARLQSRLAMLSRGDKDIVSQEILPAMDEEMEKAEALERRLFEKWNGMATEDTGYIFRDDYLELANQYGLIGYRWENIGNRAQAMRFYKEKIKILKMAQKFDTGMWPVEAQIDITMLLLREGMYREFLRELKALLKGEGFPELDGRGYVRRLNPEEDPLRILMLKAAAKKYRSEILYILVSHESTGHFWNRLRMHWVERDVMRMFNEFDDFIIALGKSDGFIQQGERSKDKFALSIDAIRSSGSTVRYQDRISKLTSALLSEQWLTHEERGKIEAQLRRFQTYRVYGFNAIVEGRDDFYLGSNSVDHNELFLATDLMVELENRGPPSLADEYLLHEMLCPIIGHYRSIILQQKIFPQHYINKEKLSHQTIEKPYKGMLGSALRDFIDIGSARANKIIDDHPLNRNIQNAADIFPDLMNIYSQMVDQDCVVKFSRSFGHLALRDGNVIWLDERLAGRMLYVESGKVALAAVLSRMLMYAPGPSDLMEEYEGVVRGCAAEIEIYMKYTSDNSSMMSSIASMLQHGLSSEDDISQRLLEKAAKFSEYIEVANDFPREAIVCSQDGKCTTRGLNEICVFVAEKYGKFEPILDTRASKKGMLAPCYVGIDHEIKRIVNPEGRPMTGIYGGSGADLSNFMLSTDCESAYFIDKKKVSADNLMRVCSYWQMTPDTNFYAYLKYWLGYGTDAFLHNIFRGITIEMNLMGELRALGVKKEDIVGIDTDPNGRAYIKFKWAYHGSEKRLRTITFIDADISKPDEYPDDLKALFGLDGNAGSARKFDLYYQRAAQWAPDHYKRYIEIISSVIRPGGYLITDDHVNYHSEESNLRPLDALLLVAGLRYTRDLLWDTDTVKFWDGITINNLRPYGWKVSVRRKLDGIVDPRGGSLAEADTGAAPGDAGSGDGGEAYKDVDGAVREAWHLLREGYTAGALRILRGLKNSGQIIEFWPIDKTSRYLAKPIVHPEPDLRFETPLTRAGSLYLDRITSRVHDSEEEFGIMTYRDDLEASSPGKFASREIATNIWKHADYGFLIMHYTFDESGKKKGIKFLGIDKGKGIKDTAKALEFGYSTAGTRGVGLSYLSGKQQAFIHNFNLESVPGKGTLVSVEEFIGDESSSHRPLGLIGWLWKPLIRYNQATGRFGRFIAVLGGLEEALFSGLLMGGSSLLTNILFGNPEAGLFIGFGLSSILFPIAHFTGVYYLSDGVIVRAPPTFANLLRIGAAGFIFRIAYLAVLLFAPQALPLVAPILLHSIFNLYLASRAGFRTDEAPFKASEKIPKNTGSFINFPTGIPEELTQRLKQLKIDLEKLREEGRRVYGQNVFPPDKGDPEEKPESPDMSDVLFDTFARGDSSNRFILKHINKGSAVEIDEKAESIMKITKGGYGDRIPAMEEEAESRGVFDKIRKAKDPARLNAILNDNTTNQNFLNLGAEEHSRLVAIVQEVPISMILGEVLVGSLPGEIVIAHVRTGYSRKIHGLGPTIWIGEMLFNRLTEDQLARLLLEEAQHILKPPRRLKGKWINVHGEISSAKNPSQVIEHSADFLNSINISPAKPEELAVSLKKDPVKAEPELPEVRKIHVRDLLYGPGLWKIDFVMRADMKDLPEMLFLTASVSLAPFRAAGVKVAMVDEATASLTVIDAKNNKLDIPELTMDRVLYEGLVREVRERIGDKPFGVSAAIFSGLALYTEITAAGEVIIKDVASVDDRMEGLAMMTAKALKRNRNRGKPEPPDMALRSPAADAADPAITSERPGEYANDEDFAIRHTVGPLPDGYGSHLTVKEIMKKEMPAALDVIKKIKETRAWMDSNGAVDRPLVVWQNVRLGELYPYFSESIKKELGVVEITQMEYWAYKAKVLDFGDGKPLPDHIKNARIVLIKEKLSSESPEGGYGLRVIHAMALELRSPVMLVDHSYSRIAAAQNYVEMAEIGAGRGAIMMNAERPNALRGRESMLNNDYFFILLNCNPNILQKSGTSLFDDTDDFLERSSENIVVIGGVRQYSYDAFRRIYGKAIEEAMKEGGETEKPKLQSPLSSAEKLIKDIHEEEGLPATIDVPDTAKVLLSENLFGEIGRLNLARILHGTGIEIAPPIELKRRATNAKTTKEKLIVVMTKDEFDDRSIWTDSDKKVNMRSSLLLLNDKLDGANYLYAEGVIKLALAIMRSDKNAVRAYYSVMGLDKLEDNVLSALGIDPVAFALSAVLKLKPIAIEDLNKLEDYKDMMERYLIAA